ncbi:MAG: DUF3160 domain-containing protein [Bryobacteraceae bacterium]|jgi:hypothetical protein
MRLLALLLPSLVVASVFDVPEPQVAPSPTQPAQVLLAEGAKVVDFDVSPAGPTVALLVQNPSGAEEICLWIIGEPRVTRVWAVPAGFNARSLAYHPQAEALFIAGARARDYAILRIEKKNGAWTSREIHSSPREIRRLVPGPRPFVIAWDEAHHQNIQSWRLFFGLKAADGRYSIHSITEDGQREYQAIGPKEGMTKFKDDDGDPSELVAPVALPVAFHPAGHLLVWQDGRGCFQVARYGRDHWSKSDRLFRRDVCGGSAGVTPNGAGILQWLPGRDGVNLFVQDGVEPKHEAAGYQLVSAPSSVPDGRGIVGVTRNGTALAVNYIPIHVPLADSVNAWMFAESGRDVDLLARNGGLFRDLNQQDQLYSLYDSEAYECGGLDESTPTRPYLVTTDSFWELFAAAYEGIFIVRERQVAIPAFWKFVESAHASLARLHPQSPWTAAFAALVAVNRNEEAGRILNASGSHVSSVTREEFDYGELKPRGHYTATPEAQRYFRAFRYLTRISTHLDIADLRDLPPEVRSAAMRWIGAYEQMIAPSRSALVWQGPPAPLPEYVRHPGEKSVLFPLSWGFDNEVLYSTIYHDDLPAPERIESTAGRRLIPSALDIAAALGSRFARELLAGEIAQYPNLNAALDSLAARSHTAAHNLYQQWIEILGEQWADSTPSPNGALDDKLWRTKRLQTGLASWATLRHATVLVNERVSAECGEGGFEFIIMRPPRGYVEPDPRTFGRIGELFDAAKTLVDAGLAGSLPPDEGAANESLRQGLLHRLDETAAKARLFQSIATKETRGEPLTAKDYEEILYFGRVAEHHFLVFKSLANKDLALSTPDPMPKVADVSDIAGHAPYLFVAVGRPMEWDHIVPWFGHHEIVKGAAYSFYEFTADTLLDDADWLKKLPSQPHPAWVAPFVSPNNLSCPARDPF